MSDIKIGISVASVLRIILAACRRNTLKAPAQADALALAARGGWKAPLKSDRLVYCV